MFDKIRDLLDRIPRWGELAAGGRTVVVSAVTLVVAAVVVLSLWGAGVFGGGNDSQTKADELPYGGGMVDCERIPGPDATEEEFAVGEAAAGQDKGLPYRANIGDVLVRHEGALTMVSVWVCMEPGATQEQVTDTATVIARNIKANYPGQADIDALTVRYLGTGQVPLKDARTYWADHTFAANVPVKDQRANWEWDADPGN